ncbi:hypothetical protein [Nocardia sp. NPDC058705]|uniref:hypothetical protein n=1 Tax=Nocardia sp. NPDC058705 TaxID=3346609 RepID=UPI00367B7E50
MTQSTSITNAAARRVARRLAAKYGVALRAEVDTALGPQTALGPRQYADLVGIAGLVMSTVTLGWQIYHDIVSRREGATSEILAAALLQAAPTPADVEPGQRQDVIDATVADIVERGEP